jgi:hypothetical protein
VAANVRLYSPGEDHKENTSCRISPLLPWEQTLKKTVPSTVACRLGSDHIENMSYVVCLATVVNTCHIACSIHVAILFGLISGFRCSPPNLDLSQLNPPCCKCRHIMQLTLHRLWKTKITKNKINTRISMEKTKVLY